MPKVIEIEDQNELVPTSEFKHMEFPFDEFNPVQSRIFEVYEGDSNIAIAAATSAGKTACCEMYFSHELQTNKRKCIYIGPLKALAKEKEEDWTDPNHSFSKYNLSICTGDYRLTRSRQEELDDADIILMTPEMLSSRARNYKSEKSNFLKDTGVIVFDESHLLTVPSRGDHIEIALMKMLHINPDARIVFLSATMPNVDEICEWLTKLTKRDTYYLKSDYRPCPLSIHYETYYDRGKYDEKENQKVMAAMDIVEYYDEDKFLIFAHTKRTGELMKKALQRNGVECDFHNANLSRDKRQEVENKFKEDPKFKVLVSTSTTAWGLNLPARRVIILGLHRGLSEVENYDIFQMIGRAGRPKYDPRGDAYILLPESKEVDYRNKLRQKSKIVSQLLEKVGDHYKTLAFHVVSEIHHGNIRTKEEFHKWYNTSLAHFQNHDFDDGVIDAVIDLLEKYGAIRKKGQKYESTAVGKVASLFYFSPFDVSDLKSNFYKLFKNGLENDDYALSFALGNIDTHRWGIANRQEKEEMATFGGKLKREYEAYDPPDSAVKVAYAYHSLMSGRNSLAFSSTMQILRWDSDRLFEILGVLDTMAGKWDKQGYFKKIKMRIAYGAPEYLIPFCQIPSVGKIRAERLWNAGIKSVDALIENASRLPLIMKVGKSTADKVVQDAKIRQML